MLQSLVLSVRLSKREGLGEGRSRGEEARPPSPTHWWPLLSGEVGAESVTERSQQERDYQAALHFKVGPQTRAQGQLSGMAGPLSCIPAQLCLALDLFTIMSLVGVPKTHSGPST